MEEKNESRVTPVKISDDLNRRIQELADKENKSFNAVFNELIEKGLEILKNK